ncbi:tail fiber domain-containing protein [Histomonas meleagridis]|uniref:tail fiber domain-containing protein n=1 Tax=Histomonas meleagridis TaxID=135588 RepID=UPI003559E5D6|nr:tail fiber domain-containing protein [Histomonas meleagridis]
MKGIKTNVVEASEIIDKDDLEEVLENYPTNDQITEKLNTITSITLPQLYYNKSQSDEKYSTKSHTHNTINNDLTVNGNVQVTSLNGFQLATSGGGKWDTKLYVPSIITLKEDGVVEVGQYIDMHNNADYDKDNTWRITANTNSLDFKSKTGSLLSFGSNGNIKCATINNVDITKISSNDHNHDEIYAKKDHEHTNYASTEHTHSYNDLNDKPETFPPSDHTHSYNDLTDIPPVEAHMHSWGDLYGIPDAFVPVEHYHDTRYALIDHTHPEYASKDHNHDTKYAASNHTHSYNDLTDIPIGSNTEDIHCSTINGFALDSSPADSNLNIDVPSIAVIKKDGVLETGPYIDMHTSDGYENDYSFRIQCKGNVMEFIPTLKGCNGFYYSAAFDSLGCTNLNCSKIMYSVTTNGIDNIGNIKSKTGQFDSLESTKLTLFHSIIEESGNTYQLLWRIYGCTPTADKKYGRLYFESVTQKKQDNGTFSDTYSKIYYIATTFNTFEGTGGLEQINTTIIHNAPVSEDLTQFQIGSPVFCTGNVFSLKENGIYTSNTSTTDCIPSVKTSGTYKEYLGICVSKNEKGYKASIGVLIKREVEILQDTIDFATHGDFYFRVNNTADYEIGDVVLFDGNKLSDDLVIITKILNSIVGKVTGKIDEHLLSVFKE